MPSICFSYRGLTPLLGCLALCFPFCGRPETGPDPAPVPGPKGSIPEQLLMIRGTDTVQKQFFTFNDARQLTRARLYLNFPLDTGGIENSFQYDAEGRLVANRAFVPGHPEYLVHRQAYHYQGGRLFRYVYTDVSVPDSVVVTYHYNPDNTLRARTKTGGGVPDSVVYRYGPSGKIAYSDQFGWIRAQSRFGQVAARYWHTYGPNGLPRSVVYRMFDTYLGHNVYAHPATIEADTSLKAYLSRLPLWNAGAMLSLGGGFAALSDFTRMGLSHYLVGAVPGTDSTLVYADPIAATATATGDITVHRLQFTRSPAGERYELIVRRRQ